jgi:hypothetical protein
VVRQLDANRAGRLPEAIKEIDKQLADLNAKRAEIAAAAASQPRDALAQSRLADNDRRIAGLLSARSPLAEALAAAGNSSVVASPTLPIHPDSRELVAKLGLACLLGIAVGLIITGTNEALRPRVAGAAGAGRLLDVPVLGEAAANRATLTETARRIRLAATRAGVSTIVLARADGSPPSRAVVELIQDALHASPAAGPAPVGVDTDETQLLPDFDDDAGRRHGIAVLSRAQHVAPQPRPYRIYGIDEIDIEDDGERTGLVVLAGRSVRNRDLERIRNLLATAGWPLLGMIAEGRPKDASR